MSDRDYPHILTYVRPRLDLWPYLRCKSPIHSGGMARRSQMQWTGVGISMGAGLGMVVGLLGWGGVGIAFGAIFGGAAGLVVGAIADSRSPQR